MATGDIDSAQAVTPLDAAVERRRRLVVFGSPDIETLNRAIETSFPTEEFEIRGSWSLHPAPVRLPLWQWSGDEEEFSRFASGLLREFVYPLVASGANFCIGFPFVREYFAPQELDLESRDRLDIEDIGTLLTQDALSTTLPLLGQLTARVTQTPIEERLFEALTSAGLQPKPQIRWGRFLLDFLVERDGLRVAVEADGQAFHDEVSDRERDGALKSLGIDGVLHFSGSRIHREAGTCAAEVARYLQNGNQNAHAPRRDRIELDPSQRSAVAHGAGPARVLAPAGSGKTTTLVERVVGLMDGGVEPAAILVLAFNKKATEQLVERIGAAGIPVSAKHIADPEDPGVVIANFNAFGNRYQRELLGLDLRLEQSDRRWREMMKGALQEMGVEIRVTKKGSNPVGAFLRMLDRVKADLVSPAGTEVVIDYFDSRGESIVQFEPVFEAFEKRRLDAQIQSFGDQLPTAIMDLLGSPSRRHLIQSRFEHVLVDEFQDLNESQLALVDVVSRPWRNLYAVGDDDQLIYGWRYADPENILKFHERMPAEPYSATYTLEINYRGSRSIVRTSRRVIENNKNRVWKDIRPRADAPGGSVRFFREQEWRRRATEMCEFLRHRKEARGRQWRDLAVLCRYKAQQPLVALALDQAGIPRSSLLAYRLFSHPSMRLLRTYLSLVRAPGQVEGAELAYLLNRPNRFISNELVLGIEQSDDPWGRAKEICSRPKAPKGLVQLVAQVTTLRESYKLRRPTARGFLEDVLEEFELVRYWSDHSTREALVERDAGDPVQLVDAIRMLATDVPDTEHFLATWDERTDREGARWDMSTDTLGREEAPRTDQVVIGTMHSSKGREYDAVVLFDYHSNLADFSPEETEEERRLFYVGLTRARESVLLTIDGAREGLHRFFKEAIEPSGEAERERLTDDLRRLREEDKALTIETARVQRELETILSGEALKQAKAAAVRETRQIETHQPHLEDLDQRVETKREETDELGRYLDLLERQLAVSMMRRVGTSLTGSRRRLQRAFAEARARHESSALQLNRLLAESESVEKILIDLRQDLADAEDQIALLHARPELVAAAPREHLDALRAESYELSVQREGVEGRIHELDIIAPARQHPGEMMTT
jgi:DNA helicase-2/ATP-dependent DNA helicase PcrA